LDILLLQPFYAPFPPDFVLDYLGEPDQKGKTRKVKPIWIYWSKRQWVAMASDGPYANLHFAPVR